MSLRPNSRTEIRKKNYKVGVDAEEARRKREDNLIVIRKNKREDNLTKKRRHGMQLQQFSGPTQSDVSKQLESFPAMVAGVKSHDSRIQLEATTLFRKLLSIEKNPPIDEVVDAGVVPRFVEFLTRNDNPQLQFEAAWALTNITSGTTEHTKVVINNGALLHLVDLINSPHDDVCDQAIWALGNIAGDSPELRDLVLSHGALLHIVAILTKEARLSTLRNGTWALSNLCRGWPQPPFEQIKPAISALQRVIELNDNEVLTDVCWALSYLTDGTNDKIQAVIDAGLCSRIVDILLNPSDSVLFPTVRMVGNMVSGDDDQTQVMINNKVLPYLLLVLKDNYKKSIRKETCWAISNITAGNRDQIEAVIDANIIPPLIQLVSTAEFEVKREAAWALSNATLGGSEEHIKYLVSQGCIKPLCDLLESSDPNIVLVCLQALENILEVGEAEKQEGNTAGVNLYAQFVDDAEGLDKIESLQYHANTEIYEKAVHILEEIYWGDDDEDHIKVAPSGTNGQPTFSFGANQPHNPPGGFSFH